MGIRGTSKKGLSGRFWEKVNKGSDIECWNWVGAIKNNGYGVIGINKKIVLAHRVSWKIHNKSIENNMNVLHKCDNRKCVNPNHLFLGTQKDNIHDMIKKNRKSYDNGSPGEKHGRHKLKENQVIRIRNLYSTNQYTKVELGKLFKVSDTLISYIINRKLWRHI